MTTEIWLLITLTLMLETHKEYRSHELFVIILCSHLLCGLLCMQGV